MRARTSHRSRGARRAWTVALVVPTVAAVLLTAIPTHAAKPPRPRIAYVGLSPAGGIHSVDLNGRHHQRLTPKGVAQVSAPTWSPSGNRIAYLTRPQGDGYANIRVMRPNGRSKQTLLRGSPVRSFFDLAWAPRARRIAVTMQNQAQTANDVAVYSRKTHRLVPLRALSGTGWQPADIDWSPDGKLLIFSAYLVDPTNPHELAGYDLWTIRPSGTGLRRLTNTPAWEFAPVWSPDGRRIAYSVGPGCTGVVIANADGTSPRRVPGSCMGGAHWAPGGGRLVITLRDHNNISLIRLDGSERKHVAFGYDAAWRPR